MLVPISALVGLIHAVAAFNGRAIQIIAQTITPTIRPRATVKSTQRNPNSMGTRAHSQAKYLNSCETKIPRKVGPSITTTVAAKPRYDTLENYTNCY